MSPAVIVRSNRTADPFGSRGRWTVVALAAVLGAVPAAQAAERIGSTEISQNIVQQITGGAAQPIAANDSVFANENVRTGVESAAKFVFSDSTNLAIGPTSSVKLDRFVYNTDVDYKKAAVKFTTGAFRFTTGGSEKKAYDLKTDTATIGVRGTIIDVLVANGETTVTLVEGECVVCPRSKFDGDPRKLTNAQIKKYNCQDLTQPNQTTRVTRGAATPSGAPFSFAANFCASGGLCSTTTASNAGPGTPLMCYMKQD